MRSKTSNEGYLLIDNRAAGGTLLEAATVTCCHCQRTYIRNPLRVRARGYCAKCDAYVCDNPACSETCTNFWSMIEDEQTKIIHREIAVKL